MPRSHVVKVLQHVHDQPAIGHPGIDKTIEVVKAHFYWDGMEQDTKRYVQNCHACHRAKPTNRKPAGLLRPLPISNAPWKHISTDFVGPLPLSEDKNTIMVVVDRQSKERHFIPCFAGEGGLGAEEVAKLYVREIFRLHGMPDTVVSDRGSVFVSNFWRHLCAITGTKRKLSSAYHPQTDGQTEIVNKELKRVLRTFCNHFQTDWVGLLPFAEFAGNYHPSASTGISPFQVARGYLPRLSFDSPDEEETEGPLDQIARDRAVAMTTKIREGWAYATGKTKEAQERQSKAANKKRRESELTEGDYAWIPTEHVNTGRPSKSLDHKWLGPFKVLKAHGGACTLDLPEGFKIHPTFSESILKKDAQTPLEGQNPDPPPPIEVEDEHGERSTEYEVERILAARHYGKGKRLKFRVQWKGYGPDLAWYNTDRNEFDDAAEQIEEFYRENPSAPTAEYINALRAKQRLKPGEV